MLLPVGKVLTAVMPCWIFSDWIEVPLLLGVVRWIRALRQSATAGRAAAADADQIGGGIRWLLEGAAFPSCDSSEN